MPVASHSDRAQSAPESGAAGGSYPTRSPKVKTMTSPEDDPVDMSPGWSLAYRSRPEVIVPDPLDRKVNPMTRSEEGALRVLTSSGYTGRSPCRGPDLDPTLPGNGIREPGTPRTPSPGPRDPGTLRDPPGPRTPPGPPGPPSGTPYRPPYRPPIDPQ